MDKLVLEVPSIKRKEDALDFIKEFFEYNSEINGTGDLQNFVNNYEDWLIKLADDCSFHENYIPAKTLFLVRESDNSIVGIINMKLELNKHNAIVSYSIRPTERNKGYSKIILYLGLKECIKHNINNLYLTCNRKNIISSNSIISFEGKLEKEIFDGNKNDYLDTYTLNVNETIQKYKYLYE